MIFGVFGLTMGRLKIGSMFVWGFEANPMQGFQRDFFWEVLASAQVVRRRPGVELRG